MTSVHIDCSDYAQELEEMLQFGVKYACENEQLLTKDYTFTFAPEFAALYEKYSQFCNPLIYGKNTMLGIVAVEVVGEELLVFGIDGSVKKYPYKSWILTPSKEFSQDERLEGFLHYKYIHYTKPDENTWRIKDKFQIWNSREAAMTLHGLTLYKGLKPSQLGVLSFDIESAGLTHDDESDVFIITNAFQKNGAVLKKHFRQDEYENTGEMIEAWCKYVREINPDILVGHNVFGYDLPYLAFVGAKFGKTLGLGRDGSCITFNSKPSKYRVDGNTDWEYKKAHIFGRQIIDGMFLAVKYDFGRKYPSWGLKPIVEAEGLQKLGRTFYDASKIRENWHDPVEREKIVAYAVDDSEDSLNLYNLMIPAYFYTCQSLPIPFEEMMQGATGKWINSMLVRAYLQDKRSIPKADESKPVKGGMSYGLPGCYSNTFKIDIKSMYPSIILQYKLYPTKKDPDFYYYYIVEHFTKKRFEQKDLLKKTGDKMYEDLQSASKLFINSSYGVCGTSGLNFNDFDLANTITRYGRNLLKQSILWATGRSVKEWWNEYDETGD